MSAECDVSPEKEFIAQIEILCGLISDPSCSRARIIMFLEREHEFRTYLSHQDNWNHLQWRDNPLCAAAQEGRDDIVKMLLDDYGLHVNARCKYH